MIAARRNFLASAHSRLGVVWLFVTTDAVPDALADLLQRAWPALLVLTGWKRYRAAPA